MKSFTNQTPTPIREVATKSIYTLKIQQNKLEQASFRLKERDRILFETCMSALKKNNKEKASVAINTAIAKRFEADLQTTSGVIEKELIRTIIQMLRGEIDEIVLRGENQNNLTMVQIQTALQQSSSMSDDTAHTYMEDKFTIEVEGN